MSDLLKWIQKHKNSALIIAIFLVLASILAVSFLGNGTSDLGLKLQSLIAEIQKPITQFGQSIESGASGVFSFRATVEENQELQDRIAQLEEELLDYKLIELELEELEKLSLALNFKSVRESKQKVAAKVVSIDGTNHFNIFTIDAGTDQGVHEDAIVVNGQGMIGRVYEVGDAFSKVISIVDTNANISFKIYENKADGYLGIAYGNGKGGLSGYMLDTNAVVSEGDKLLTSGMGIYPEGLLLGTVSEVLSQRDSLLHYIEVDTAVDFSNLSKVLVIVTKETL
ncbi:MAG: rod shape-determining protein MreC [Clostridia bacterium]|nr:rod shape-determining protein MreC [Clostridia bacterium]